MARKHPQPFWREQTGCWYVQLNKKQHRLAKDRDEAFRLYHELMNRPVDAPVAVAPPSQLRVDEVLDLFLSWTETNQAKKTYTWHRDHAQNFIKSLPTGMAVGDVKPFHVTRVMDAHPTWSASTKNGFARSVQRAFKWAVDQGLIPKSPIPKVEKPAPQARETIISQAEFDDLLGRFPDQEFRDLLVTAWETGCRPNELMKVEARHVDLANNRWVFKVRESKGRRTSRIVYLTDRAAEITARLAAARPDGPLFRNADGLPWDKNAINRRFHRKKQALGRKVCLYHIRHSFATRMLLAGIDAIVVATWLGHSDVSTLSKTYQHMQHRPEFLHDRLKQANAATERVPDPKS